MKTEEFVKTINKLRLKNKNNWYMWQGTINDRAVALKGYNTWLQIFRVNGLELGLPMEMSAGQFKTELANAVS